MHCLFLRLCHIAIPAADCLSPRQVDEVSEELQVADVMAGHESHKRPEQTLVAAPKIAITQSQLLCPGSFSLQSPMVATPSSTSTGWTGRDLSTVTWPQQQAGVAGYLSMLNGQNRPTRKDKGNTSLLLRLSLAKVMFLSSLSGCQV